MVHHIPRIFYEQNRPKIVKFILSDSNVVGTNERASIREDLMNDVERLLVFMLTWKARVVT